MRVWYSIYSHDRVLCGVFMKNRKKEKKMQIIKEFVKFLADIGFSLQIDTSDKEKHFSINLNGDKKKPR